MLQEGSTHLGHDWPLCTPLAAASQAGCRPASNTGWPLLRSAAAATLQTQSISKSLCQQPRKTHSSAHLLAATAPLLPARRWTPRQHQVRREWHGMLTACLMCLRQRQATPCRTPCSMAGKVMQTPCALGAALHASRLTTCHWQELTQVSKSGQSALPIIACSCSPFSSPGTRPLSVMQSMHAQAPPPCHGLRLLPWSVPMPTPFHQVRGHAAGIRQQPSPAAATPPQAPRPGRSHRCAPG